MDGGDRVTEYVLLSARAMEEDRRLSAVMTLDPFVTQITDRIADAKRYGAAEVQEAMSLVLAKDARLWPSTDPLVGRLDGDRVAAIVTDGLTPDGVEWAERLARDFNLSIEGALA